LPISQLCDEPNRHTVRSKTVKLVHSSSSRTLPTAAVASASTEYSIATLNHCKLSITNTVVAAAKNDRKNRNSKSPKSGVFLPLDHRSHHDMDHDASEKAELYNETNHLHNQDTSTPTVLEDEYWVSPASNVATPFRRAICSMDLYCLPDLVPLKNDRVDHSILAILPSSFKLLFGVRHVYR
jgi:hypothetical protein